MGWMSLAAVVLTAVLGGPASGQNLLATDPDAVMRAMQEEGFLVTRDTAGDGTPRLNSKVSSSSFRVFFYGCEEEGDACTSIQLSAGYDLTTPLSALRINQWNSENRYSRAFIDDEGDPYIKLDVVMHGDGVGRASFAEVLDIWRLLIEDFEEFIDW